MKRINSNTGVAFKYGDVREDGYTFFNYNKRRIKQDGYYGEQWYNKAAFDRKIKKKKEYTKTNTTNFYSVKRRIIGKIKTNTGCVDCGFSGHPDALEFDHVSGDKAFTISTHMYKGWLDILDEMEKCEIRCANCHRIKTANRRKNKNAPV